ASRRRIGEHELPAAAVAAGNAAHRHRQIVERAFDMVQQPVDQIRSVGGRLHFHPVDNALHERSNVDIGGMQEFMTASLVTHAQPVVNFVSADRSSTGAHRSTSSPYLSRAKSREISPSSRSRTTSSRSRSRGFPQPPPPGRRISTRSPRFNAKVLVAPSSILSPS